MLLIFKSENTTSGLTSASLVIKLRKISLIAARLVLVLFIAMLFSTCTTSDDKPNHDPIIAKVFNKSLFQSELNNLIGDEAAPEDSLQIVKAYIEKWVRDAVLMHEAEKYVLKDLNVDELVRDYRASLIRHNYEKLLVETTLDSTINETQLDDYYQENKEQHKLKQPIIKCHFIKIAKPTENWQDVKKWWNSEEEEDYRLLLDYCSRNAEIYLLDDTIWYELDAISQHLPTGKLRANNYKSNKKLSFDDDHFEYLLKIFDSTAKDAYAPLEFIREQASKVILHKRKIRLLEDKKEEMYERERNNVKIYVD